MIFKSFYRKKTTKIYLLILILIFTVLGAVIIGRNNYIKESNLNYAGSFLYVLSRDDVDFSSFENVESFEKALHTKIFYLTASDKVMSENEVVLPSFLKNSNIYLMNNIIEYVGKVNNHIFTIFGYYDTEKRSPILHINPNVFKQLRKEIYI